MSSYWLYWWQRALHNGTKFALDANHLNISLSLLPSMLSGQPLSQQIVLVVIFNSIFLNGENQISTFSEFSLWYPAFINIPLTNSQGIFIESWKQSGCKSIFASLVSNTIKIDLISSLWKSNIIFKQNNVSNRTVFPGFKHGKFLFPLRLLVFPFWKLPLS